MILPLALLLHAKLVLVVGGGPIGTRKAMELVEAGAEVHLVTRRRSPELDTWLATAPPRVRVSDRAVVPEDVDDAWLVFAATEDPETQRLVAERCLARRVFCVAVDDKANATAWGMGLLRRGPLVIAISSQSLAPALTRVLREILEELLPDEPTLEQVTALRARWKAEGLPLGARFRDLVRRLAARETERDEGARNG
jgi:siroheme synthase-like protein